MSRSLKVQSVLAALMITFGVSSASAQVFGTFTWQMQPFCNKVTLTLTSVTGNFTLDGSEDRCGAAKKASAVGIGVFNPDGTVGIDFTIVTPGGQGVHVAASVSPANGQGTWSDSVGNSGTFAFFGATPGLPVRPTTGLTVARSGQVMAGSVGGRYVANSSFTIVHGAFPLALPAGTPALTLEYRASGTSATCPGIGRSSPGRLCVYAFNNFNIGPTIVLSGGSSGENRRYGFTLDIVPTTAASNGYFLASWAYVVP